MAYDVGVTPVTLPAGSDLSTKQFQFVSVNSSGQLAVTANAAAADGVLLNNDGSAAGRRCAVATTPGQICRVAAGGTIANGDLLEVLSGKAVTQSSGKIVGRALAAAVSGDNVAALLIFQR